MSDAYRIILTSVATIVGSIFVLVFGQFAIRFFIDPVVEARKAIGEVADVLIFYANIYANPAVVGEARRTEASQALRQQASLLRVRAYAVPVYTLAVFLGLLRPLSAMDSASRSLMGLSNAFSTADYHEVRNLVNEIREALQLPEI